MQPGQSGIRQLIVSVACPRQVALPPNAGSLHARALTLEPRSQVVEHWDHSPHSCQLLSIAEEIKLRIKDEENCENYLDTSLMYILWIL